MRKAADDFAGYWPLYLGGGALIGGGARIAKAVADIMRDRYEEGRYKLPHLEPAGVNVPLEVTPEQADAMRQKGITVKKKVFKQAEMVTMLGATLAPLIADAISAKTTGKTITEHVRDMAVGAPEEKKDQKIEAEKSVAVNSPALPAPIEKKKKIVVDKPADAPPKAAVIEKIAGPLDSLALGALGTLGAAGGWYGVHKFIDSQRRSRAQQEVDKMRQRVEKMLNDEPDATDTALYKNMKAAEAKYFEKKAFPSGIIPLALTAAGGLAALKGLQAYSELQSNNKYNQKAKALRDYLAQYSARPGKLMVEPVEVVKEEEKAPSGSPAAQAELGGEIEKKLPAVV